MQFYLSRTYNETMNKKNLSSLIFMGILALWYRPSGLDFLQLGSPPIYNSSPWDAGSTLVLSAAHVNLSREDFPLSWKDADRLAGERLVQELSFLGRQDSVLNFTTYFRQEIYPAVLTTPGPPIVHLEDEFPTFSSLDHEAASGNLWEELDSNLELANVLEEDLNDLDAFNHELGLAHDELSAAQIYLLEGNVAEDDVEMMDGVRLCFSEEGALQPRQSLSQDDEPAGAVGGTSEVSGEALHCLDEGFVDLDSWPDLVSGGEEGASVSGSPTSYHSSGLGSPPALWFLEEENSDASASSLRQGEVKSLARVLEEERRSPRPLRSNEEDEDSMVDLETGERIARRGPSPSDPQPVSSEDPDTGSPTPGPADELLPALEAALEDPDSLHSSRLPGGSWEASSSVDASAMMMASAPPTHHHPYYHPPHPHPHSATPQLAMGQHPHAPGPPTHPGHRMQSRVPLVPSFPMESPRWQDFAANLLFPQPDGSSMPPGHPHVPSSMPPAYPYPPMPPTDRHLTGQEHLAHQNMSLMPNVGSAMVSSLNLSVPHNSSLPEQPPSTLTLESPHTALHLQHSSSSDNLLLYYQGVHPSTSESLVSLSSASSLPAVPTSSVAVPTSSGPSDQDFFPMLSDEFGSLMEMPPSSAPAEATTMYTMRSSLEGNPGVPSSPGSAQLHPAAHEQAPAGSSPGGTEWIQPGISNGDGFMEYGKYRSYGLARESEAPHRNASGGSSSGPGPPGSMPQKKIHLYGKTKYFPDQPLAPGPSSAFSPKMEFKHEFSFPTVDYGGFDYSKSAALAGYSLDAAMRHNHTYATPLQPPMPAQPLPLISESVSNISSPSSASTPSTSTQRRKREKASAQKQAREEMDSAGRDEKRARAMKIPISIEDIVNLPMDEFNERLSKYDLTEAQLSLIRDIRRRGKNKVAAQNCRKRKLDQIISLADEVRELQEKRDAIYSTRDYLSSQVQRLREKYAQLYSHIFQNLRDSAGNPYSRYDYMLHHAPDTSVHLISVNGDGESAHASSLPPPQMGFGLPLCQPSTSQGLPGPSHAPLPLKTEELKSDGAEAR